MHMGTNLVCSWAILATNGNMSGIITAQSWHHYNTFLAKMFVALRMLSQYWPDNGAISNSILALFWHFSLGIGIIII